MDPKEVVDIVKAAEVYMKDLQKLDESIKKAEQQIMFSGNESLRTIDTIFTNLKKSVIYSLDNRQAELEKSILKVQNEGIKPLRECQKVISEKVAKTKNLLCQGNKILDNSLSKDSHENFYIQSAILGNLPAVPSLSEVPFINFTYLHNTQKDILDMCDSFGSVSYNAPVQIASLTQKPGSILVRWEEAEIADDRINNIQEFRLQFAFGDVLKSPHLHVNFHDCYIGTNTEYLKKDLKLNTPYSFRVCCKLEGAVEWSSWSISQVASTSFKPFSWNNDQKYFTLNNDNKLSTKISKDSAILLSNGPQFKSDNSVEFTILDTDSSDLAGTNAIGLCYEDDVNVLNTVNYYSINTFVVLFNGKVYLEGKEKATRLPPIQKGSKISFTCEKTNGNKYRLYVESGEKNVTYDWNIGNNDKMYFFMCSISGKSKVLVE